MIGTDFEIEVFRNDTVTVEVSFEGEDGVPIDLTGWSVYFAARDSKGNVVVNRVCSIVGEPTDGTVRFQLNVNVAGRFLAEFEMRSGTQVVTLCQGWLIVKEDIRL